MRKLNSKNKLFIVIFSLIVLAIVGILIFSVILSSKKEKSVYNVSNNTIIFDSDSNLIDTSTGGIVTQKWDNNYFYISSDELSYDIGKIPVIYEKTKDEVLVLGDNYQIFSDGSVVENDDITTITDLSVSSFYKLSDRVYLIISPEIYNIDKSIYTSDYLIVYIDKQGNASVYNDVINIKTINPMNLVFDKYTFDIANELLVIDKTNIDLKLINGSTNEYKPREEADNIKVDYKDLVGSYNELVNSFQQYVDEVQVGANQVVNNNTNNNVIINGSTSGNSGVAATNKTNITKKVSLRGAISYPSFIDVTYMVSDIEDKYQAVYLLVTGVFNGVQGTQKILLDKYSNTYRIMDLSPKNEYSISLGYVEAVTALDGNKSLVDEIEDVINVRTTNTDISLKIDKISRGYVYFNLKMTENFALESGKIVLYSDNSRLRSVNIDVTDALSKSGFSDKMLLNNGNVSELRIEDAVYAGNRIDVDVKKKFVY